MSNGPDKPKIVVIGGGSGSSVVLRGLKQHPSSLTAVVTMFDSGGSSGLLREEFGYPPFGDLRQCIEALSEEAERDHALRSVMSFRFSQESSLNGHNLGNLLLAALTTLNNDLEEAIDQLSSILKIRGQVVPVSLQQADLCAELEDGTLVSGESAIDLRGKPTPAIRRVFLDPQVDANPRALQAIVEADAVILGPGDLYTSIVPNLLTRGVAEALARTRGTRIYICNLMTKVGETDGFKASDFVREMLHYIGGASLDWVVINTGAIPGGVLETYRQELAELVDPDLETVQQYGAKVFGGPLATDHLPLRHDATRVAEAIFSVMACSQPRNGHAKRPLPDLVYRNGAGSDVPLTEAGTYATSIKR